jgi:hypothetical protein
MSSTKILLDYRATRNPHAGSCDEIQTNERIRVELSPWGRPVTVKNSGLELEVTHNLVKITSSNAAPSMEIYTSNGTVGPKWTWNCGQDIHSAVKIGDSVYEYDRNGTQIRTYKRPDI